MKAIRIIAFLLTLCMLSSVLFACNKQEEPSDTSPSSDETPEDSSNSETASNPEFDGDLEKFIEITQYNGKMFDEDHIDIGQGSWMHVIKNTTPDEYNKFKTQLEKDGFVYYTSNEIGKNKFTTYITESQIVNVMLVWYDYDEENKTDYGGGGAFDHYEVRVTEDNRYFFDLPGLQSDNIYKNNGYGSLTMISEDTLTYAGRMGYIYQLADGSFFVIDGGVTRDDPTKSATPAFMAVLEKFAPDPNNIVIAGWLITHMHDDHMGVYYEISQNEEYLSKITVEKLIHNMPSESEMAIQDMYSWDNSTLDVNRTTVNNANGMTVWQDNFNEATAIIRPQQKVKAHAGQTVYIRDLSLTIYVAQDLLLFSTDTTAATAKNFESNPWHNSSSIVSMINYQGKDMLFFADAHVYTFRFVIYPVYHNDLKADVLSVAHHGYADTRAQLANEYVDPDYILWPLKRGHYDGFNPDGSIYSEKADGSQYTGVIKAATNSVFMNDPSIIHVYHEKDLCVTIDDFSSSTWEFYEWDAIPNK